MDRAATSSPALPWGGRLAVPIVSGERCTACARCVEACPTGAITLVASPGAPHDLPVIDADRCTYCTACEPACPERAIECPFEIVGADSAG